MCVLIHKTGQYTRDREGRRRERALREQLRVQHNDNVVDVEGERRIETSKGRLRQYKRSGFLLVNCTLSSTSYSRPSLLVVITRFLLLPLLLNSSWRWRWRRSSQRQFVPCGFLFPVGPKWQSTRHDLALEGGQQQLLGRPRCRCVHATAIIDDPPGRHRLASTVPQGTVSTDVKE